MKAYELRLAAKLLHEASDEFSNHGCNDFDLLDNGLSHVEAVEFALEANNGGEDAEHREHIRKHPRYAVVDWLAMTVLADKLLAEAEGSTGVLPETPHHFGNIAAQLSKENEALQAERDALAAQLQRIQDAVRGCK